MEEKKKVYRWFVEPKNDHANEVMARALREINEVETNLTLKDDQDFVHKVYQVPDSAFVTRLSHSELISPADFVVFNRLGDEGPIKFWELGKKKINIKLKKEEE